MDQDELAVALGRIIGWLRTSGDDVRAVRGRLEEARQQQRPGSPEAQAAFDCALSALKTFDDERARLLGRSEELHEAVFHFVESSPSQRVFPDWHPRVVSPDRAPTAEEIEGDWRTSRSPESVDVKRKMLAEMRRALEEAGADSARELSDAELLNALLTADKARRRAGGEPFAMDPSGKEWAAFIESFAADLKRTD
jgi:hypothetical protein